MKAISIVALALCIMTTGFACHRSRHKDLDSVYSVYACLRINGVPVIRQANGDLLKVHLTAEDKEEPLNALLSLKRSVKLGLSPGISGEWKPSLYLVGTLTDEWSIRPQSSKNDVSWEPHRILRLRGWFLVVPYQEYPQTPEWEQQVGSIHRTSLEPQDFDPPLDPSLIYHDDQRELFGVGVVPPSRPIIR